MNDVKNGEDFGRGHIGPEGSKSDGCGSVMDAGRP